MCRQEFQDLVLGPRVVEPVRPRVRRVGGVVGDFARVELVPAVNREEEIIWLAKNV